MEKLKNEIVSRHLGVQNSSQIPKFLLVSLMKIGVTINTTKQNRKQIIKETKAY